MIESFVVDADTHFWQPIECWKDCIEPAFREVIVEHVRQNEQAAPRLGPKGPSGLVAAHRIPADDPKARLEWMDSEGIDVCVIYPTSMNSLCYLPDPDAASAAARGLNRWAANFASSAPERLKPCMVLPWYHPERALAELEFAIDLGLRIGFAAPASSPQRRWSDAALDPLWSTMQASGIVMTFHEFTVTRLDGSGSSVARPTYTYPMKYLCGHTMELQLALMDMVLGGVLQRFPSLRVGLVEGHAAWLPGWLDMLDTAWQRPVFRNSREAWVDADTPLPSQVFRRQGFVVAFPEDLALDLVIDRVGPQALMLSTDYPHPNATYDLVERFAESYAHLPPQVRMQALGGNAASVFGWKLAPSSAEL